VPHDPGRACVVGPAADHRVEGGRHAHLGGGARPGGGPSGPERGDPVLFVVPDDVVAAVSAEVDDEGLVAGIDSELLRVEAASTRAHEPYGVGTGVGRVPDDVVAAVAIEIADERFVRAVHVDLRDASRT